MPFEVKATTPMVRLAGTAVMFALALGLFVVASVTHVAWPLFVAWAPLIAVPWLLTRPEAGQKAIGPMTEESAEEPDAGHGEADAGSDHAQEPADAESAPEGADTVGPSDPEAG